MQKNIFWKGITYQSLESCIVNFSPTGAAIRSSIVGKSGNTIYQLDYQINTNEFWETTSFSVKTQLNDAIKIISLQSDGKGNWFAGGEPMEKFNGCMDIDISLTPFTNTLPIKRLNLAEKTAQQIKVLYIDVLAQEIKHVQQQYTRLSATEYKFENVPNDFEAIISVDELGLVVNYPELFERSFIVESNYPSS